MSTLFCKNIKLFKKTFDLSSVDIANKLSIKIEKFRSYEFNNVLPNYKIIIDFANLFNVSTDFVLFGLQNNYINYINLFSLAEKVEKLPEAERSHIDESIKQFIKKNYEEMKSSKFDDKDIYFFKSSFHENIKILRDVNKITLENFAKSLGYATKGAVWNFEKKSFPPIKTLQKICNCFNTSAHYLLTGHALSFNIKTTLFMKHLLIFDKNATIDETITIRKLIEKILENNNFEI